MRKDGQIMPQYYNYTTPYYNAYPTNYYNPVNPMTITSQAPVTTIPAPPYMINVDGENAAKAWQPTTPAQPNVIIPLFDSDGVHVYFKTYDQYGRMNPLRKGRIVFEEETQASATPDTNPYVTKNDLQALKEELISQINSIQNKNNQNGNTFRGEKR